ncbi:unnamed protein product [Phytophthora fragariaefolia]|uniref:Unnamed protein product n=1 Tax=Phytophthora fragariaefolia TaxID=1490495 RepID=A0A9W6UC97_9STRA|nr:unnamed protein product [Phytophthora fragariaefolia]
MGVKLNLRLTGVVLCAARQAWVGLSGTLSVAGTEAVAPTAAPVMQAQPIKSPQSTLEQEGNQDDDDPADHQRQFAAAYAEGQREAASEAEPQVTRPASTDRAAPKRAQMAQQQRAQRVNMTTSQTERRRAKHRERQSSNQQNQNADDEEDGLNGISWWDVLTPAQQRGMAKRLVAATPMAPTPAPAEQTIVGREQRSRRKELKINDFKGKPGESVEAWLASVLEEVTDLRLRLAIHVHSGLKQAAKLVQNTIHVQ